MEERERIPSQVLSPPDWGLDNRLGSRTIQYKLLAKCSFWILKNPIKSESYFFLSSVAGLRYIALKQGRSWCPWEGSEGWRTPHHTGLKCNLHIMLKAGQCPEVSLGVRTIFWRCWSLFGPSCWQIPGQLGYFEQLCLYFSIDPLPGYGVLILFVSWEDVILISNGFSNSNILFEGKGKEKSKWQRTLN